MLELSTIVPILVMQQAKYNMGAMHFMEESQSSHGICASRGVRQHVTTMCIGGK